MFFSPHGVAVLTFKFQSLNQKTEFLGIFTYFYIFPRDLQGFFRILQTYKDLLGSGNPVDKLLNL